MKLNDSVRKVIVKRPRAQRFDIPTAISYRTRGAATWYDGVIKNVSSSGVLLQSEQNPGSGTSLEMRFALPIELGGAHGAFVACRGNVVRVSNPAAPSTSVFIATTIHHAKLVHRI